MKVGDLVRMKYTMFWTLKSNPRIKFKQDVAAVINASSHIVDIMWPDGKIDRRCKDLFEVINESR